MLTLGQFIIGCVLLVFGATWLVHGAVALARRLKLTSIIDMTVVTCGARSPGLAVSARAAPARN